MKRSMVSGMVRPMIRSMVNSESGIVSRYFSTLDPIQQGHYAMQNAKVMTDYEVSGLVYLDGTNDARLFGNLLNFSSRLFVSAAGSVDFRPAADSAISLLAPNGSVPLYKLSSVKVSRVGATGYIYVNGALVSSGAVPTGASNINVINRNSTSYGGGVLADVVITDLTTPSNSESWKIGNPPGTNTEQSSSGNNLLTYVNVTNRELFTEVNGDWLGVELVKQPINVALDWIPVAGAVISGAETWGTPSTGGIRSGDIGAEGKRLRLSYSIFADSSIITVKDSSAGQGGDPTVATVTANTTGEGVINYTATLGGLYIRSAGVSNENVMNSMSLKRILEVA